MSDTRWRLIAAFLYAGAATKLFLLQVALQPPVGGLSRIESAVLSAASALLLFSLPLFLRGRARIIALIAVSAGVSLLAFANGLHFRYWRDVISFEDAQNLGMARIMFASIRAKLQLRDSLYVADTVVALLALLPSMRRSAAKTASRRAWKLGLSGIVIATVASFPFVRAFVSESAGKPIFAGMKRQVAARIGLVYYQAADIASNWREARSWSEAERRAAADSLLCLPGLFSPGKAAGEPHFGSAAGRNVIVVSAESLQPWLPGLVIDGDTIAPNLSRLVRESIWFSEFHSETHLGITSDAEFSALNSLHPLPWSSVAFTHQGNHFAGLPWLLRKNGYRTVSAVGEPGNQWNMERMHPAQGFEESWFESTYRFTGRVAGWVPDREFLTQTAARLASVNEPFFAFLITSSMHHPFVFPDSLRGAPIAPHLGRDLDAYLRAARYFDRALGEFLTTLESADLLDRSLLVVYGDHDAYLDFDEGLRTVAGQRGSGEYDRRRVTGRLPFLIRLPAGSTGARVPRVGGHTDIAPTILALLGIEARAPMMGNDLLGPQPGLAVFRDGSFATDSAYLMNAPGDISSARCYERRSGKAMDCRRFEGQRSEVVGRLEASDLIIRRDLAALLAGSRRACPD